eukprot:jgi/Mesen1/868/ME000114S10945
MSQPRVTVRLGGGKVARKSFSKAPQVEIRDSGGMYSDRAEQKRQIGGDLRNKIQGQRPDGRSGIRAPSAAGTSGITRTIAGKRQREDDKWGHDMYNTETGTVTGSSRARGEDLRNRLNRKVTRVTAADQSKGLTAVLSQFRRSQQVSASSPDLRQKLSGPLPEPQASNVAGPPAKQRRLVSVVSASRQDATRTNGQQLRQPAQAARGTTNQQMSAAGARAAQQQQQQQTRGGMHAEGHPTASAQVQAAGGSVLRGARQQQTPLLTFLTKLGLEKYLSSFQAEEVDMAALRHMKDEDLKELNIPMGPRKKILLAVAAHV